jgi:hypothetical protein
MPTYKESRHYFARSAHACLTLLFPNGSRMKLSHHLLKLRHTSREWKRTTPGKPQVKDMQECSLTTTSSSYISSIVKESVVTVLKSTLDEIRRGELFTGPSGSALQATVMMINQQDILDAVFQRANLEALESEVAIKKHIVAALAGLVQREMVKSVDSLAGY